jgi:hypothetical protein
MAAVSDRFEGGMVLLRWIHAPTQVGQREPLFLSGNDIEYLMRQLLSGVGVWRRAVSDPATIIGMHSSTVDWHGYACSVTTLHRDSLTGARPGRALRRR